MKRITLTNFGVVALGSLMPVLALAQSVNTTAMKTLINNLLGIFNTIVLPVLVAIAVIYIVIAAFQFAISGADEEKRTQARQKIVWGMVGIVILFAIYAIIGLIVNSLTGVGIGTSQPLPNPQGVIVQ